MGLKALNSVTIHITKSFKRLLFLIVVSFTLSNCSSFKLADNYTSKKFTKGECTQKNIIVDSVSVEFWDNEQKKPVLVLIHGFGATAEFQWYKQIKVLENDYRLIIPSLLYFGETTPIGEHKYMVQDQVSMIHGLLDRLNISKANVCGVSYGGLIAAEFTRQHSQKVDKLILFDAVLKYYTETEIDLMCKKYGVSDFKDLFVPNNQKEVKRLMKLAFKKPYPIPPFFLKSVQREVYQKKLLQMRNLLNSMYSQIEFYQNQEYKFKNKTLFIWGNEDDVAPLYVAKKLNKHFLNSELKIIYKTKHMPNIEKPKQFNKLITTFLKS